MSLDTELYHYGVLGMKWGVRKDERSDGTKTAKKREETPAEKRARFQRVAKRVAIGAGVLAAVAGAGYVTYEVANARKTKGELNRTAAIVTRLLNNHGDTDEVIEKGAQFFRRSYAEESAIKDRVFAVAGEELPWQELFGPYRIPITAAKELKAPSIIKQLDIIAQQYGQVDREALLETVRKRGILSRRLAEKASPVAIAGKTLDDMISSNWSSPRTQDFLYRLKKEGYSAVLDPNREGNSRVLFDASNFIFGPSTKIGLSALEQLDLYSKGV